MELIYWILVGIFVQDAVLYAFLSEWYKTKVRDRSRGRFIFTGFANAAMAVWILSHVGVL